MNEEVTKTHPDEVKDQMLARCGLGLLSPKR